jgi:hypothetical protein
LLPEQPWRTPKKRAPRVGIRDALAGGVVGCSTINY